MEESVYFEAGLLLQLSMRSGNWHLSGISPKKNCNSCFGRGYSSHNTLTDQFVPCRCVLKQLPQIFEFISKLKLISKQAKEENINLEEVITHE